MASKLMVVIGAFEDEDHIKRIVNILECGIEQWLSTFSEEEKYGLIQELNNIPEKESSYDKSKDDNTGVSRFRGRLLDSTVLISPTCESLHYELLDFFLSGSPRCCVAFGGFISETTSDWHLQDGLFAFDNLRQILQDSKVSTALSDSNCKVTISCCKLGSWAKTEEELKSLFSSQSAASLEIMNPLELHKSVDESSGDTLSPTKPANDQKHTSKIEDFSQFLEDGIGNEVGGIFNTLKPPLQEGFLKIRSPCLYIFPAGHGDSAFFAVNGFNMLVNGGASTKPWFWKLIQHVDRVDSVLATHLGADNLPGLNSLLLRKLQERQVKLPMDNTTAEYQEMRRCLISPDLGPLFMNAPTKFLESLNRNGSTGSSPTSSGKSNGTSPAKEDNSSKHPVLKTVDIVKDTLRLSKALNMEIVPLVRKPSTHPEPITLFSKVGLGRLEMYVLSPLEGSKELSYINEKWGCNGKTTTPTGKTGVVNAGGSEGDASVTNLSSVCCLLVWHPSNPHERIVRVLFPGNATQTKIFEGLDTMKNLPFLQTQFVTKHTLNKQKHAIKTNGAHSAPRASARPTTSGGAAARKQTTVAPKKLNVPVGGAHGKREAAHSAGRPADKRPKTEKPAPSKARPTTAPSGATSKSAPQKTTHKSAKPEASGDKSQSTSKSSSSVSLKKSTGSRPGGGATTSGKTDAKRQPASAKPATSRTRPQPTLKNERAAKKPQTPSKSRSEPVKSPQRPGSSHSAKTGARKSPEKPTPSKKTVAKAGSEKPIKKKKEEPAKTPATPPEDLTPDFVPPAPAATEEKEAAPKKAEEPLSTGSEEPTTSVLSDRHSPEGEDVPPVDYAESPPLIVEEKEEKQDPSKQEDITSSTGFVIMDKPEIAEQGEEFISENGSSIGAPGQKEEAADAGMKLEEDHVKQEEEELISSDASTPTPIDPTKDEKVIHFVEPDKENTENFNSEQHAGLERQPTPFHSLQESSGNTDDSPVSEGPMENERNIADEAQKDETEQKETEAATREEEIEYKDQLLNVEEDGHEIVRDVPSDIQTSFNSSMEGSYELYPAGRSPPPASDRQETIAETISDFKHDEVPPAQELEAGSPNLDTQQQQADLLEDPTMSTEAPDPRFSVSTTTTESRMARMDSPFSPSEIGQSATSDQQPRPDAATTAAGESSTDVPAVADVAGLDDNVDKDMHNEVPPVETEASKGQVLINDERVDEEELLVDIHDEVEQTEDRLLEDDNYQQKEETPEEEKLDGYPQEAWTLESEKMAVEKDEEFDLHAAQLQEEYGHPEDDQQHDQAEKTDQEKQIIDTMQHQEQDLTHDTEPGDSHPEEEEGSGKMYQEEEDQMQLTGSLASSAQDQGPDGDYSESTSLTETGATPDVEQPPVGFDYDGPDVKDYEQGEGELISKSDLSLSSPDENFPLHGGDSGFVNGNTKDKVDLDPFQVSAFPETPEENPELLDNRQVGATSPQRYHPAYTDPTAPLADTEEDMGQSKSGDDSLLDVNAKPFIPKSSVPADLSPTYAAEADFTQEDEFSSNGNFAAAQPVGGTNPFMVDLMSNMASESLEIDPSQDARLPPVRGPDPCAAQDSSKPSKVNPKKTGAANSRKPAVNTTPLFVDLTYVPSHANKNSVGLDFFKRVRARYYVISGNDQSRDEPSTEVLNHLLEGKRSWFSENTAHKSDSEDTNITVIPTHDTSTVREWYKQNFKELESCNIHMVASGSKVLMQDESVEACKIEF